MGALSILQDTFRQARRANGLGAAIWERLPQGPVWNYFIDKLWHYQWTREQSDLTNDVRRVLYEESQGIIDIVVKLFMLGQARAMELGAMGKCAETMDAALLQTVAADHFKIIAPMITALKCGKSSKIDQYDDLRPLEDYAQQVLQATQDHLERRGPFEGTSAEAKTTSSTHAEVTTETLITKLKELGVAEDIAQQMAIMERSEYPEASLFELVGLISAKLFGRAPEAKPSPPSHSAKDRCKSKVLSKFEMVVAAGNQRQQTGHATLREAGLVTPPQLDRAG
jgi:hypothetical protein